MAHEISIDGRTIGTEYPPLVIAEIGINHGGEFNKVIRMIKDAERVGCECIKFQCHMPEEMYRRDTKLAKLLTECSLTEEEDKTLKEYVESKGMIYLSTPFCLEAVERLERLKVKAYKIGSGECEYYPLVRDIADKGKPVIMSTGMSAFTEIRNSVDILGEVPLILMQCTSIYPAPYREVNLGGMAELRNLNALVGLSDHSIGNYASFGAVALGACVIEKHFTSNRDWKGVDMSASINPSELEDLIKGTKAVWEAR